MQLALTKKNGFKLQMREGELASTLFLLHAYYMPREGACLHTCVRQTLYVGLLQ